MRAEPSTGGSLRTSPPETAPADTALSAVPERETAPSPAPSGPARSDRWSVVRLLVAVAAIVAVAVAAGAGNLLIVIVAIIVMVMVHELGHFATAKWSKMLVTQYFVGFGPTLWSIRRGETEYGVKAIPAGGFVKIPGMTNLDEVDPALESRTYRQKPFRNRVLVSSAGSIMHFLMAFVLIWVAYVAFGAPQSTGIQVGGFVPWVGHSQNAAQAGGLRPGDVILTANGRQVPDSTTLTSVLSHSVGKPLRLVVRRDGRQVPIEVVPRLGHTEGAAEALGAAKGAHGIIGISEEAPRTPEGPVRAIGSSVNEVGRMTAATVAGIGHLFSPHGLSNLYTDVTNSHAAAKASATGNRPQSIIGATNIATQALSLGVYYVLIVLALLNIALGLLNMLPMLPLDGGHVAIALYERVRTRKGRPYYVADAAKLLPVVYAFMAILIVIVASAVYLDIAHPVTLH